MPETIVTRTGPIALTDDDEARMHHINATLNEGDREDEPFDHLLTLAANVGLIGCIALGAFIAITQVWLMVHPA